MDHEPPPPVATTTKEHQQQQKRTMTAVDNNCDGKENNAASSEAEDKNICRFCNNSPCFLEEGLYEELVLAYELGLDPADLTVMPNSQIRFRLYRYATSWIHGYLGKGNRRELPQCVRTEIRDLAPESSGNYVGFKKKKRKLEDCSNRQD
jgi:hypothetical protein